MKIVDLEQLRKKYGMSNNSSLIIGMLKGEIPLSPKSIFYARNLKEIVEED
jgi:hypothetical protein